MATWTEAVRVEAPVARSATVSAPAAGEAVAAVGLKGAAEACPVAACASAAGRCASADAEESTGAGFDGAGFASAAGFDEVCATCLGLGSPRHAAAGYS